MKIEIVATPHVTKIGGVPVRLWEGTTESGIPCKVFVHRVAVHRDQDSAQFDAELAEQLPVGVQIDLRQILS
jgi:hypothetical protein